MVACMLLAIQMKLYFIIVFRHCTHSVLELFDVCSYVIEYKFLRVLKPLVMYCPEVILPGMFTIQYHCGTGLFEYTHSHVHTYVFYI